MLSPWINEDFGQLYMATEISFDEAKSIWLSAAGKNTGGIIEWFKPPFTTRWTLDFIWAKEVGEMRFIGGEHGNRYDALTGGTYSVKDAAAAEDYEPNFKWIPSWHIIAIRDPENKRLAILDGNSRALQLYTSLKNEHISPEEEIKIVIGDLNVLIVRIAKAASSLWK